MSPFLYFASGALVLAAGYAVFRVLVRRDYERRGRLSALSVSLEWAAILLWVAFGSVNQPADWPALHVGPVSRVIGWGLVVSGVLTMLTAMLVVLGIKRSHGLDAERLERRSLYGISRNPQLLGFLAAMIGYLALWPSWRNLGTMLLLAVITHLMVRTEEEHLRRQFGEAYERYCSAVPRYIGPRRR
jgi:protein-S-isoprenylcysteine O-methyltransferase Ste14